ncbi:unnamed protein product [Closterium sp. NIES-64]|nr:unnamed protein product [Closterium sp. NIES-64]
MKDFEVLRDKKAGFTEPCLDLGLAHCSVLLVVRPGDLLLPDEEQIGTFYRHLDPKTSSKLHEEEAANVLRFFDECVKAELNREGREWTAKPPSAEVLSACLESLAASIRDVAGTGLLAVNAFAWSLEHLDDVHRSYDPLIIENPKLVGLKALRLELVHYVEKAALNIREAASTVGRGVGTGIALGGEAEEAAAGSHSGGHGPTDGGEEEHEREDKEGGGEEDGGSDEEEEDEEREDDDVVTGEEEAVQFAGEKVADKSGGSGPKSGKKARGSGGSIPTRMASKAAVELLKAAERENKKLREEKVVAEKRLEYQTARMDTLFGVVTSTVNKLTTVADSVTSHEQTLGRSLQTGVDAMRAVEQEAVNYRGSTLEFMNQRWLPTVQALYLTATAAQGRRREDDVLLLQGVADALGEKIRTVVSAEVKAAMESEAQGIAAAVTTKVIKELRDDLVKVVTSATQHGLDLLKERLGARPSADFRQIDVALQDRASLVGKTDGQPVGDRHPHAPTDPPSAHDAPPSCDQANPADELLGKASVVGDKQGWKPLADQHPQPEASPATVQGARPSGGMARMADKLLHLAAVVGQPRGEPVVGQHVQPSTSTPTARPTGIKAQLTDDLLRPAAVVGQQGGPPGAGHHLHPSTSTATAQDARLGGVTAVVDELLRPAAVVGQHVELARAGQHPHTATSPASVSSARPVGVTAQLADQSFRPEQRATGVLPSGAVEAATSVIVSTTAAALTKSGTAQATSSLPNPPPLTTGSAGAASLPVHGAMVGPEPIPIPKAVESQAVEALIGRRPSLDEYMKWIEDHGQKTLEIPPTHTNQAVDQGAEAPNVTAATAWPSASTVEAAVWRVVEEAGGVDEDILASIVMPNREIEDPSAAGAKSSPATTGEVSDGKQKRKGKGGPAKAGSSKGTSKAATQGRKGSGVRVDKESGLATSEMKFGKKSRYIYRSMDKSEAAYCIAVAISSFDGFVSEVIRDEFDGVKEDVMEQYKADWNVARLIPGGMWTVMWSRGANVFRDSRNGYPRSTTEVAAGEGGAAATVRGTSPEFAKRCKSVIKVVLQRASTREVVVGEVADTVTKDLQGAVLRSLPEDGDERKHDDLIARVMIENLAFWGDCCVGGPKFKARGVVLPLDAGMKVIVRDRGARGQHKGKQAADA